MRRGGERCGAARVPRPDVERGVSEVAKRLPGILREKKPAWRRGCAIADDRREYQTAVTTKNDAALLAAAEKLHGQFEKLARILHPAIRELEDFHTVLYRVYHHELPADDFSAIRESAPELKQKMMVLDKVKLPQRHAAKESRFIDARAELSRAVDDLVAATKTSNVQRMKAAVERVHTTYRALAAVFE